MTTKTNQLRSKKDVFEIFDGRVKIYRTNSQVYQYQIWIPEEQKYVRKSLHTTDKEIAIRKAEEGYVYYRARVQNNEKIFSITSSELRDLFLVHIQKMVDNKQLSLGRQTNIKTFTKHYLDFVGKTTKIQNIDPKFFRDYLSFRRKSKSDIQVTVIINESITIKQMYKFAVDENLINVNYKPDFGVMKKPNDESVRDSYTPIEYTELTTISKNWYKSKDIIEDKQEQYYRRLLNDFIIIMANGGFRTQEVRLLKWKDILKTTKIDEDTYSEVVIRSENTKINKSRVIEMRRGDVFERIKSYSLFTEKDDYIFSSFDKKTVIHKKRLYEYFNKLTETVKSKYPNFDTTKTLYSLRHLYISIRIQAGLNVYDIAKICGTSLQQIQKHYDSITSLTTSQKMNRNSLRFDKHGNVIIESSEY